jgi:hypothetical protein
VQVDVSDICQIFGRWMNIPELKLRTGELRAGEVRAVLAVLRAVRAEVVTKAK